MLPSNSILHSRTWPGLGGAEAGLKNIITLSCVELCVISICHDTAVLTVVHLSRWPDKQTNGKKKRHFNTAFKDFEISVLFLMLEYLFHLHPLASISYQWLL